MKTTNSDFISLKAKQSQINTLYLIIHKYGGQKN